MSATTLWLYFVVVFGVIVLPGMDMAFVMASSLNGGRRAGFAAVAGIVVGGIFHMIFAATGLSLLLRMMPGALQIMLIAGSAYIAWIGWSLLRVSRLSLPTETMAISSRRRSFFGAMATCLLNPKAYVFMLAIFPQFVSAQGWPLWQQASALALITALTQVLVYGSLALMAARAQVVLANNAELNAWMARVIGVVLLAATAFTLYTGLTQF